MDEPQDFDWNSLPPPEHIALPIYLPDSPARRDEESKEAFNEAAARAAFGDGYVDALMAKQQEFRGDWWMLGMLLRCEARARVIDPDGLDLKRMWSWHHVMVWCILKSIRVHLECVSLRFFYALQRTNFAFVRLDGANFREAELQHTFFYCARLSQTTLLEANLTDADLDMSDMDGAILAKANLDNANVRGAKNILFDDTKVKRLDIEGNAPDPWSTLRRTYTGPMFFVHLLLLVLLPYAAKVLTLTTTARGYDALRTSLEAADGAPPGGEVVRAWLDNFDATHTQTHAVWVLLGWTRDWWWIMVPAAIMIIFYNGLRGYLTWKIGILRDQADRVDRTPTLVEYHGYCHPLAGDDAGRKRLWSVVKREWLKNKTNPFTIIGPWHLHQLARVLFWISIASAILHVGSWLWTTTVPVPK